MEMPAEATQCPVKGCGREKDVKHVVCEACWARIGEPEKAELHRAWAKRKALLFGGPVQSWTLETAATRHYKAQRAAIAAAERGGGA